jgi:hypothetical protein
VEGLICITDASKVHQLRHGFVQGEVAETWIEPKEKKRNRMDVSTAEHSRPTAVEKAMRPSASKKPKS